MENKLILYLTRGSPACRSVLQLCRMLDLNVELKNVDFQSKEQKSEEFAKLNPVKEVPVLIDGDFVLYESRAILAYLVNSRRPDSKLYPNNPQKRAVIDQRLYYDATAVFPSNSAVVVSLCNYDTTMICKYSYLFRSDLLFMITQKL
jgi:glutathione S-transferase